MLIQGNHKKIKKSPQPDLWKTINKIQFALGLNTSQMADLMLLTEKDFLRIKNTKQNLRLSSAMSLCDKIELDFDSLMLSQINYKALNEHYHGNINYIPEKYLLAANSKRRTVTNILNYIEDTFGWERRLLLLRHFQMKDSMFEDVDANINLRFSVDISNWCLNYYKDNNVLVEMGNNAVKTHIHSPMGKELSKARNARELYELMCDFILEKYIEKNFKWSMKFLSTSRCIIEGKPDPDLVGILGKKYMLSYSGCLIRQGFMESIPFYLNYSKIKMKKHACVAWGDSVCRFELDFNSLQ